MLFLVILIMAFRGPSLIGFDTIYGAVVPYLVTDGYLQVYGANRPAKASVFYSSGLYAWNIDTDNGNMNVGATYLPTATSTYDIGSSSNRIRAIYADTIDLSLTPLEIVQTDANGLFTTSNTLPFGCFATNLSLTNPLILGLTSNRILQTGVGNTITASNTLTYDVTINGSASLTKFQVQSLVGDTLFKVDTTNEEVRTFRNLLDNGAGDCEIIGTLTLKTTDRASKFSVLTSGSLSVFNVNSISGACATKNNTLDNGSGAATIVGDLGVSSTNSTTKFQVLSATSVNAFRVNTSTLAVTTTVNTLDSGTGAATFVGDTSVSGSNSATKFRILNSTPTAIFTANTSTNAITTISNTLDNGSGSATFIGNVSISGANSTTKFRVINATSTSIFTINSSTNTVTTLSNTLDNGSGNMTVAGPNSVTKFRVLTATNVACLYVDTTLSSAYTRFNTLDNGTGSMSIYGNLNLLSTNSANKLSVVNASSVIIFNVNTTSSAVTTLNNTLDDGAGNTVVIGNSTIQGANSATKFRVLDSLSASHFSVNTSSAVVATKNNTLDDGSGALTAIGNTTIQGVNSTSKFRVVNNSSVASFTVNTTFDTVSTRNNTFDNGSGAVTIVGDTFIQSTNSFTKLRVIDSLSTAIFNVNTSSGAVTTKNNTIDDGSGNISSIGSISLTGANNANKLKINDIFGVTVFGVNTSTLAVTTSNNTLDNGLGAATVVSLASGSITSTGNVTISGTNSAAKFDVGDSGAASCFRVNTSTGAVTSKYCTLDNGAGVFTWGTNSSTSADMYATSSSHNIIKITSPSLFNGAFASWRVLTFMNAVSQPGYLFTGASNSSNLYIMPGYKGSVATAGWVTFDLPGTGNFYFWDNIEGAGTFTVSGTSTQAAINCYQIAPRADNTYTCGANGLRWSAVWAANGTIQTSDETDKEAIENLLPNKALDMIKTLRPVKYRWKDNKQKHLGFLAQQVKETLSSLDLPNNGLVYEPEEGGKYGLNYASIIPVLVSAIQQILQVLEI